MQNTPGFKLAVAGTVFGILLGICFIAYSNSLHNGFMLDDGLIFSDVKLNNIKFLSNAFFPAASHLDKTDIFTGSDLYYRPVAHILFLISYLFFGHDPFGYHLFNLFLFTLMCFTVYIFIGSLFKDRTLAFITGVLFAVHPINVFYVNYITSSLHSVRFICMFLSLIFFLNALERYHKVISYSVSFFCFVTALLCHETSIVLPFYIIFVGFHFKNLRLKDAILKSCPYFIILLLYLIFRYCCTSMPTGTLRFDSDPLIYLATFSRLIFLYSTKLLFPQYIVFLWNSPLTKGGSTFIWLAGLAALILGWRRSLRKNPRGMVSFCLTWALIGFIPVFWASHSHITEKAYGLIIEPQWVTFASVGFFVYLAFIGTKLYALWGKRIFLFFLPLIMVLIVIVRDNNQIWGDEYKYYFYWYQQIDPPPPPNYSWLANIYMRKNEFRQARYYYVKALESSPKAVYYHNIALIDAQQGLMDQAKKEFLLTVQVDPNFSSAYNNLGVIYLREGDLNTAQKYFLRTIQLNKYCINARSNLGLISLLRSDYKGAIKYYQENLGIAPDDGPSLMGLSKAYTALKNLNRDKNSM